MSKSKPNRVKIDMEPYEYEVLYHGHVNNNEFSILHRQEFNIKKEDFINSVQILWADSKLVNRKTFEEAIKMIFKHKLEKLKYDKNK